MDIRNFTLEGKQLMVVGRLSEDGVPMYDLFKLDNSESLSFDELRDVLREMRDDINEITYEYASEPHDGTIAEFEKTWGEDLHDQAQECDGGRADAQ